MRNFRLKTYLAFLIGVAITMLSSCKFYSMTGAQIEPEIKTMSVKYIANHAPLVNPLLSQELTEAIKNRFIRQTSLDIVNSNGDLHFEGVITGYSIRPIAIASDQAAAQSRLTITVKINYTNTKYPEKNYQQSFSRFADFDATTSIQAAESEFVPQILTELVDDIFNKAVVNW